MHVTFTFTVKVFYFVMESQQGVQSGNRSVLCIIDRIERGLVPDL